MNPNGRGSSDSILDEMTNHLILFYTKLLQNNIVGPYLFGIFKIIEGIQLVSIALNYFSLSHYQIPFITFLTKYLNV